MKTKRRIVLSDSEPDESVSDDENRETVTKSKPKRQKKTSAAAAKLKMPRHKPSAKENLPPPQENNIFTSSEDDDTPAPISSPTRAPARETVSDPPSPKLPSRLQQGKKQGAKSKVTAQRKTNVRSSRAPQETQETDAAPPTPERPQISNKKKQGTKPTKANEAPAKNKKSVVRPQPVNSNENAENPDPIPGPSTGRSASRPSRLQQELRMSTTSHRRLSRRANKDNHVSARKSIVSTRTFTRGPDLGNKSLLKKAKHFHALKCKVLAPFLAEIFIRKYFDDLRINLEDEFDATMASPGEEANDATSINRYNPEEESDTGSVHSRSSYQSDWRSGSPVSESS